MRKHYLLSLFLSLSLGSSALVAENNLTQTPQPFDPFVEMQKMHEEMNRIFENFHQKMRMNHQFDRFDPFGAGGFTSQPAVDIQDKGDTYEVTANIPGADNQKIDVETQNGQLKISATTQKSNEKQENNSSKQYIQQERYVGSYTRILSLPDDADEANIKHEYKDGILTVTIGKKEE